MKFAIILLVVVAIVCVIGSLVPQGEQFEAYRDSYSERAAAFILAFRLDDVFHSWWFLALVSLLCLSLVFCNLSRVRALIRQTKDAARKLVAKDIPFVLVSARMPEAIYPIT